MSKADLQPSSTQGAALLRPHIRYGVAEQVYPNIVRLIANNPKDYTGPGTNSYLVGSQHLWLIDPGPNDQAHIEAIVKEAQGRPVAGILVTHSHLDHSPAARPLAQIFRAPVYAAGHLSPDLIARSGEEIDRSFQPDHVLEDGALLEGGDLSLQAVHTPGHFPNHLCLWQKDAQLLFSGDHVMGWSTTVIVPPLGDLADYMNSLDKLAGYRARLMLPSHGLPIEDPAARLEALWRHRAERHRQISTEIARGEQDPEAIVAAIYEDLPPRLRRAACGQVQAHLALILSGQDKKLATYGRSDKAV